MYWWNHRWNTRCAWDLNSVLEEGCLCTWHEMQILLQFHNHLLPSIHKFSITCWTVVLLVVTYRTLYRKTIHKISSSYPAIAKPASETKCTASQNGTVLFQLVMGKMKYREKTSYSFEPSHSLNINRFLVFPMLSRYFPLTILNSKNCGQQTEETGKSKICNLSVY